MLAMLNKGIVKHIRNQKGNLRYEYFQSIEDPETILLVDSWTEQKALDIHHASPMMNEIINLRNNFNIEMKVERFKSDNENITTNDLKYIKK